METSPQFATPVRLDLVLDSESLRVVDMQPVSTLSSRRVLLDHVSDHSSGVQAVSKASSQGPSSSSPSGKSSLGLEIGIALAIALPIVIAILLSVFCYYLYVLRSERACHPLAYESKGDARKNFIFGLGTEPIRPNKRQLVANWFANWPSCSFSSVNKPKVWLSSACEMQFSRIQTATANFNEANILGEGGSGKVYKARLDNNEFAAVKTFPVLGPRTLSDYKAEVDLMRQVRHPNLVSLLGYCQQEEQCLLVYEFMENGSVEDQLYGPDKGASLSWNLRMKIALESARGLEYLHERCSPAVVHRDFKASNILLDKDFQAKISDFGLATPLQGLTREESMQLIGTIGYVAPEFFDSGTLTEKSDVYAFGVTLLELLTGRKSVDHTLPLAQQSLVTWIKPQLTDRKKLPLLVDPHIRNHLNLKHLYQVAAVAALCVQAEPAYRPLIMDVVQSLVPLVPIDMGGALRKEVMHSRSNSRTLNLDAEGFKF